MVAGAVVELNQILSGTNFRLRFSDADQSDIQVIFGSRDELNALNPSYQIDSGVQGYAATDRRFNARRRANIYVVNNLRQGDKWGTLLHELGHAIGIVGHTDRYLSSLFHSERGYGSWSDGFSTDDDKLVRFLYQHLRAGTPATEVRVIFDEHWVLRGK